MTKRCPDWQWPPRDAHHVPREGDRPKTYEDVRPSPGEIDKMVYIDVWNMLDETYLILTSEPPDALPRTAL